MMMNNGMNYGMGMNQMMGGVQYNQQQAKMTQPLTKEEIAKLNNAGNAKLVVDEIDLIRAKCTHKNNGQITLMQNNDGTQTCSICGATFNLVDADPAEVAMLTQRFIDVMQSIKTYYLDMPVSYANEFFVMIPLLQNTPELFKIALSKFSSYEKGSMVNQNNSMYGFNLLNNITSPGYGMPMGMPMQQPQMMQGMMPGMMPQQPMMNPGMQQPIMNNGMVGYDAYGNQMQGMQVQGNPFTGQVPMQPQMQQQPQQQVQQQNNQEQQNQNGQVTTTKTFNV